MEKQIRNTFSWINPKVEIKETKKYGNGVFSLEKIKKGEIVSIIGGHILTISDENRLLKKENCVNDKWIEISENFSIGPIRDEEITLMKHVNINHSCEPNLGFKGQIFLVAMNEIEMGEEVTFDYAMCLSSNENSSSEYKLKCLCGSKNCRGYVTENDWKLPELQKKYNGYFQWYLQEKINKLRDGQKSG